MGEYFIGSDGELYHWGWKKKDAKYIKRERKNNKWVYTYPEDLKGNNTAKKTTDTATKKSSTRDLSGIGTYKPISGESLAGGNASYISKTTTSETHTSNKADKNGFGQYKPISGESLAGGNASYISKTTASDKKVSNDKKVSSEYEAELAYNSQKNTWNTSTNSRTEAAEKVASGKEAVTKGSSEYETERDYNSQKNVYPEAATKTSENKKAEEKKKEKTWLNKVIDSIKDTLGVDEKDAFEKLERDYKDASQKEWTTLEKYREANKNFNTDPESKEFGEKLWSTWEAWRKAADDKKKADDARDEAFEKYLKTPIGALSNLDVVAKRGLETTGEWLDDMAFEVEYAADSVKDWVSDGIDNLEDATIGNVRDWYGHDELAAYHEAERTMKYYQEGLDDALSKMSSDMNRLKKDPNNEDAALDLESATWWYNYWEKSIADYQDHYTYVKVKYELTPKARIDNWIEDRMDNIEDWLDDLRRK